MRDRCFDAVRFKIRDEGLVRNKAVCPAMGHARDGFKQILGMWVEQTEGAQFWLSVMNDLKARGLGAILIAVVDGLGGFPEAIGTAYPHTLVRTCIVHLIRNSMAYGSWKERKRIAAALKAIYQAENADRGHFPHDDAARKLIYLALRGVAAKWKRPPQFWWQVKGEFAIRFEEQFTAAQG